MPRNINSYEDDFNFKKYNTLLEIKKELNEERKDNTNYTVNNNIMMNNQNNPIAFKSYKDIQYNDLFHKNLNSELEKSKSKLQKEINNYDNNNRQQNFNDILNQIKQSNIINNIDKEYNNEIENLKNKISQYEVTLENMKNQYQEQINYYIQQLSNYNIFITITTNFFQNISKKYIPNYNFNMPNNVTEPNNFIPLNQKDLEEKFAKIEQYIGDLNSELNEYKGKDYLSSINKQDKRDNLPIIINKDFDKEKNEIDKLISYNNNDSFTKTNNNNIYFPENDFIFKNEILANKVRSKSSTKPRIHYPKKLNENKKNLFKNKNNKNENKLTKRNNSYRGKEANNNLDIIQYTKKKKKKSKPCKDIPIKTYKKNKSKPDIRKPKSINLK
jgi:hypothetical protein